MTTQSFGRNPLLGNRKPTLQKFAKDIPLYQYHIVDFTKPNPNADTKIISRTGKVYYFSRFILSQVCSFFNNAFSGEYKVPEEGIGLDFSDNAIEVFLSNVSVNNGGTVIPINEKNVLEVFELSEYLGIGFLRSTCIVILCTNMGAIWAHHGLYKVMNLIKKYIDPIAHKEDYDLIREANNLFCLSLDTRYNYKDLTFDDIGFICGSDTYIYIIVMHQWLQYEGNKQYVTQALKFIFETNTTTILTANAWSYLRKLYDMLGDDDHKLKDIFFHKLIDGLEKNKK
jgi:hypothetical protein